MTGASRAGNLPNTQARSAVSATESQLLPEDSIAIVVLTHGREHLLRQCVENVLSRASAATKEIVIWDNASGDGTPAYLGGLQDPRTRVVHHPLNIGHNAYPEAFALTNARYLIELDDDIIDAPTDWDLTLLRAFQGLPRMGFLSTGLVDHPHDTAARLMYHLNRDRYRPHQENGMNLLLGPTGGYCAMTSRVIYDEVGGFHRERGSFFEEDGRYAAAVARAGYRTGTLEDLKLSHAGGPYFSAQSREKLQYYETYRRHVLRKAAIKRVVLSIPGVAALNRRREWFKSPEETMRFTGTAELFLEPRATDEPS